MRIGLFTDSYFPSINGVSVSVHNLYEELTQLGHEVFIFTNVHDNATPEDHVIRFKAIRPPKKALKEYRIGLFSYFKIKKARTFNLDIIHCHSEITMGRIARKVAKLDQIPFVYTYHTMYEDYTHFISKRGSGALKRFFKWVSLFYAEFANAVIFPTEKVAQTFLGYGFKNPYHIIPTGIDLAAFTPEKNDAERSQLLNQYKKPFPHLVYVGRISHEKSIQALLDALLTLKKQGQNVYLTVIGDGPDKSKYEAFVLREGLKDLVQFTGMIPPEEVPHYYHLADFFVSFSKTETQGLTYIEALASGLPVIAWRDVHLKAWIQPNKNGILFDTPEDFITIMHAIIQNPDQYAMDPYKVASSVEQFSKKSYGTKVNALYQSLLKKPSSE